MNMDPETIGRRRLSSVVCASAACAKGGARRHGAGAGAELFATSAVFAISRAATSALPLPLGRP